MVIKADREIILIAYFTELYLAYGLHCEVRNARYMETYCRFKNWRMDCMKEERNTTSMERELQKLGNVFHEGGKLLET